jgi:DNA-binding winged helix-turn-helix (wHTH) protein
VPLYAFGPFHLDSESRRLMRDDDVVPLSDRHLEVLLQLVARAGDIVTKDALIDAAWGDVAVTDNSLEQAISGLRRTLGDSGQPPFIETVPRRGYRFGVPVTREVRRETDEALAALLAPHRAWLEGRTLLETLERDQVAAAEAAFLRALAALPDLAAPHVGLANAYAFRFEASRSSTSRDAEALTRAMHHAREACRLDPGLAEAWATLGFVLSRAGSSDDAVAASRRAVALESDNWRHQLRLAFVSWGEERLRAAGRALRLLPGLGLAHFLAATVHVARQSLDAASHETDTAITAQAAPHLAEGRAFHLRQATADKLRSRPGEASVDRFNSVGLHWLEGLLRLQRGDDADAVASFERELTSGSDGHLYGAECCANVHYARGALAWHAGDRAQAVGCFERALVDAPGHLLARAALAALKSADGNADDPVLQVQVNRLREHGLVIDAAIATGVPGVIAGDAPAAAAAIEAAFVQAPPGPQGWVLPIDPLFAVHRQPAVWAGALAALRSRAA